MKLRLFSFTALFLTLCAMPVLAQSITGPVRVIDGDTLSMNGERIRIHGINAPESDQRCDHGRWACGQEATQAMVRLVAGAPVTCLGRDRDHYGRLVAVCYNHQGQDLGRVLVEMGMATAYRRYSTDYVDLEESARAARRGVWSGEFQDPEGFSHQSDPVASGPQSLPGIPGISAQSGASSGVMEATSAALGWVGKMAGAAVDRTHHSQRHRSTAADPRYGYSDFHDYNSDGIVDGAPRQSRARVPRSALTPPSAGAAPPGMKVEGPLSADQVCAVMALAGQPCQ